MEEKIKSLENCGLFSEISIDELEKLSSFFTKKSFSDKAIIFREGTVGRELYIIESGVVAITKQVKEGTDTVIARFGTGDFFGELTMFEDFTRTATARAQGKTTVLVISHENLLTMLEKDSKMAAKLFISLLKIMSRRIRQTNLSLKEAIIWGFEAMGYSD
ncbi:MAG TPA: cyclic nucleotide-binding domain-containing protein [Candidatus Eremiobacteraeota bacterium]|nr:MAG: Anaerobic regulatory protein [bacterium ADurb.Bin363]HPZ06810.1 cyclic nucleotide-binding domain-containing protein [Candidatus Eremiobacteraeota bacterium]